MRKCRNCRSLLLGDVECCPRCGAPVPVAVGFAPAVTSSGAAPSAAPAAPTAVEPAPSWPPAPAASLAAPVALRAPGDAPRVPSYGRLSIPSPVASVPPGAASGPAPGAPLPLHDAWQPIAFETPVKTATRHKSWPRVALAVAVVLVVGAAVMHLRSDPLPAGTSDFVAGKGVTYTSPDGAFQVQLPQQPQVTQQTLSLNGVNDPIYLGVVQSSSYVIEVASLVSPVPFRSHVNDVLDEMASHSVKSAHGIGVRKVTTMHGSQPALDARFNVNGHVAHMLVVASDASVILLLVYAKSGTDRLYKALDDSLLIR
jgi:hypothetical protein